MTYRGDNAKSRQQTPDRGRTRDVLIDRTRLTSHRLSTVLRANRLVVLDHGRIVEEGTHADLLSADGLYARLYRRQFRQDEPEAETAAPPALVAPELTRR